MSDLLPWHVEAIAQWMSERDKLPHALLIHGREGIGMVEFARFLAKSLLCESARRGPACGVCGACGWFEQGNHPDFREVRPEALDESLSETEADGEEEDNKKSQFIKIAQVRALASFMTLTTHRDGLRILLIHPAEAMNVEAANALLKTLEEPPSNSLILLVTSRIGKLLPTIKSRCRKWPAPRPDAAEALAWLKAQGIDDADSALAAAGGAPLGALQSAEPATVALRSRFITALSARSIDALAVAQQHEKSDIPVTIHWLQTWVYDLILAANHAPALFHPAQSAALQRIAHDADPKRLFRFETALRDARRLAHHPLNPRLFLEQLLISYSQAIEPRPKTVSPKP
jgi:DNA polymerase-3 subunit delta'